MTLLPMFLNIQPSVFHGVQDCRLPGFTTSKPSKRFRRPFQGNNSDSYMPLPSVFHGFKIAVCPASNLKGPPNAAAGLSKATTLTAACPCHLFFQGVQDCRFARLQTLQTLPPALPRQRNSGTRHVSKKNINASKKKYPARIKKK